MHSRYEIYPGARAIVGRMEGAAKLEELMDFVHELWADPRYSPAFDGIMDLTSDDLAMEMGEFRPLLGYLQASPHTSTGRWAVITNSPFVTACGFIYRRVLSHRHSFDVFSTREAACAYVGFQLPAGDPFHAGNEPRRR